MLPSRSRRKECDVTTEATGVVVGSTISATGGAVTGRFRELRNQPPDARAAVLRLRQGLRDAHVRLGDGRDGGPRRRGSSRLRGDVAFVLAGAVCGLMGSVE